MPKHYTITISGRVQGVAFRLTAQDEARRLGINGYVRNEPDGSVHIEAEGDNEALEKFVSWCSIGPDMAHVDRVVVKEDALKDYDGFYIRRSES